MEFRWEDTPEGRRQIAYDREQQERYLTERTPEEMRGDLYNLANERLALAETLEGRAAEYRQEAAELIQQADGL